ncbi:Six-bladed beta-propeller, TolB-like [Sergentomyia squamirostris]
MKSIQLLAFFVCLSAVAAVEEIYHWKKLDYDNLPIKENAFIGKYPYYIPENNALMGVCHHSASGLTLVTVPRTRPGIPSTLNAFCTTDYHPGTSPCPWGFPSYDKNTLKPHFYDGITAKDDYSIISVFSPIIHDECHRFYALDTGVLEYGPDGYYKVQNPAILVYQLGPDSCKTRHFPLIKRIEIPSFVYKNPTGFMHIHVDQKPYGKCDDVILYMPNSYDNCLVVHDFKSGKFWTVSDPSMAPVQAESQITYNGYYYKIPMGISAVSVVGQSHGHHYPRIYYTSVASFGVYTVPRDLVWNPSTVYNTSDFQLQGYRGCNSQSFYQLIDSNTNAMFLQQMIGNEVRCWNVKNRLNSDNVETIFKGENGAMVSDITIDSSGYIWFFSGQAFSNYASDIPMNIHSVNTRLYRAKVTDVIHGTKCAPHY